MGCNTGVLWNASMLHILHLITMADDLEPVAASAAHDQLFEKGNAEDASAEPGINGSGNSNSDEQPELRAESWGQLGPLTPPDDGVEQVTADGGVLKKVLEPGLGEKPPLFSRCLGELHGSSSQGRRSRITT
jgi:hypothetical protein